MPRPSSGRSLFCSHLIFGLFFIFAVGSQAETPPRFTQKHADQAGIAGGVASFLCRVTGDPRPNITWSRRGRRLTSQRFEIIEFDGGSGSVLRIQPLRPQRDGNTYECSAVNTLGHISATARLVVHKVENAPPGFPRIDMSPQLKVVERTHTATMLCAASGQPEPHIAWYKDFLPIELSVPSSRIRQLRSGALQISDSAESDQGKYECVASNIIGTVYSSAANLYVRVRHVPPWFSVPPAGVEVIPGGSVNVTCVAVGSPMPYVKWVLGAEDFSPEADMPVGKSVLELHDVSESANYTCVAMSALGVVEATAQVTVKALPHPPSKPTVSETTATSITLTWDSGNVEPVAYYVLLYRSHFPNVDGRPSERPYHEIDGITTTRYTVGGLSPYSEYEIRVAAVNNVGRGMISDAAVTRTGEQAPSSPPRNVRARMLSSTTMLIRWDPPQEPNGRIRSYHMHYGVASSQGRGSLPITWQHHSVQDSLVATLTGLTPSLEYAIRVQAATAVGGGPLSKEQFIHADLGVPGQPTDLKAEAKSATSLLVSWHAPEEEHIIKYELYFQQKGEQKEQMITFDPGVSYLLRNLQPGTTYRLRLAARSHYGLSPSTPPIWVQTTPSSFVKNFRAKSVTQSSVLLTWENPKSFAEQEHLKVIISDGRAVAVDGHSQQGLVTGLRPDSDYFLGLTRHGASAGGLQQEVAIRTAPHLLPGPPIPIGTVGHDGILPLALPQPEDLSTISVRNYYLVVVPLLMEDGEPTSPSHQPDEMDFNELLSASSLSNTRLKVTSQVYVAATFPGRPPAQFMLGDGEEYRGFKNHPLGPGSRFVIFLLLELDGEEPRVYVTSPYSEVLHVPEMDPVTLARDEEEGLLWVLGPVLAVIFIVCIVVTILLYKSKPNRKRSSSELGKSLPSPGTKETLTLTGGGMGEDGGIGGGDIGGRGRSERGSCGGRDPVEMRRLNHQSPGMASHPPIPAAQLLQHVEQLRNDGNRLLCQEYESIDPGQQFTWENSNQEVNKVKNRYANVIAYDHSRVILAPIEGIPGSDYINANYLDGYRRHNAYIGTQGPLAETFGDFWRMVWEQRSTIIVMLTRLEERGRVKCDQYWPSRGSEDYGSVHVTLVDSLELAFYTIRTFTISKTGSSERRELWHFHFTLWPEHGVPEHPTAFFAFLRRVRSTCTPDAGPMVVHCSAGVGRTCCLIAVDAALERLSREGTVDIYGHVTCLRAQRNYSVQTEEQYAFVYATVTEAWAAGRTEVAASALCTRLQRLTAPVRETESVTAVESETGTALAGSTGLQAEFKRLGIGKVCSSRITTALLPCNKYKNRAESTLPTDASRICLQPIRGVDGSDYINASYLDGYRQRAAYIGTQGPLPETTEDFWRMLWEQNSTIVVMLTKLREVGQDGQSRTVRQFQFTDWPDSGVPQTGEGFIDFIGQVHKTKEQFGQDGPITVHCNGGAGRTGVFVVLSVLLERMRYEGLVDVYQTITLLRTQRPGLVRTEEQYHFCYRGALDYLGSFDHYAT
uniref:protein-tyrosine-phosphatase n=1 Tax=Eptatretus burgeri TaxID=7764 RepID=A0A8C4QMN3_EPTBU